LKDEHDLVAAAGDAKVAGMLVAFPRGIEVSFGSCVTSAVTSIGGAQLYER
jgi:hypothetical protein